MINYEQFLMALRWAMNAAGVALISHGVGSQSLWTAIGGGVLSLAPFVWGLIRHTKWGTIIAANDLPEVAGVIMKPTPEGEELARSTPSPAVTTAGTVAAESIARTGTPVPSGAR